MAEEKGGIPSVPWPTVLTVMAVVGGVYFLLAPLNSSRPGGLPGQSSASLGYQDARARLWEDPVKAAMRHREQVDALLVRKPADKQAEEEARHQIEGERLAHSADNLKQQLGQFVQNGERVLVLPVMVEGGPYPENTEARLRARHAVLSALALAQLTPDDGEHVGYVEFNWPRRIELAAPPLDLAKVPPTEPTLVVPYEWCSYSGGSGLVAQ